MASRSAKPSRRGRRLYHCTWCQRAYLTRRPNDRTCSAVCAHQRRRYYAHWKPLLDGLDDFEDFLAGFFRVHTERIADGDEAARAWLDTASFECWVDLLPGDIDPTWMRKMMLG